MLFALGRFSEAAGVLNPVLVGGPGWDWSTMVQLYDSKKRYATQLAALEAYVTASREAADGRFLLGYHYMVCGHLEQATAQFQLASRFEPKDSVSLQLYHLCSVSLPTGGGDDADEPVEVPESAAAPPVEPEVVPIDKLKGKWVVDKGEKGVVTLAMDDVGNFTWEFAKDGKTDGFAGEYSMNDDGLLVLDADETQMVATIALAGDDTLKFVIAGGPPGDNGLQFSKSG